MSLGNKRSDLPYCFRLCCTASSQQIYPGVLPGSHTWHPPNVQTPNYVAYNAQGYTEWNDSGAAPVDLHRPPGNFPVMSPAGNQGFNEFNAVDLGPNSNIPSCVNQGAMPISFQEPASNGYHQMADYTDVPIGSLAPNTLAHDQPIPRVAPRGTISWDGSVYEQATENELLAYRNTPLQATFHQPWEGQQQPDMQSLGPKQESYAHDPDSSVQEMPFYPLSGRPLGYWSQDSAPDYSVYGASQFKAGELSQGSRLLVRMGHL
jgi:hypothetical protein